MVIRKLGTSATRTFYLRARDQHGSDKVYCLRPFHVWVQGRIAADDIEFPQYQANGLYQVRLDSAKIGDAADCPFVFRRCYYP
jgi:hypothetical protein